MFRASTCPSSGGQIVLSQHLVSSLSVQYSTVCQMRADCRAVCSHLAYCTASLLCLHRYVMGRPLPFTLNGISALHTAVIRPVAVFEKLFLVCYEVQVSSDPPPPNALYVRATVFGASSFNRALLRNLHTTIFGFNWAHLKTTRLTEWVMSSWLTLLQWKGQTGQPRMQGAVGGL